MGVCASKESESKEQSSFAAAKEKAADSVAVTQNESPRSSSSEETQVFKLLLLGSGESGKSTFFKKLLMQYGRGYEEEDRKEFIDSIFENALGSMKTLITENENLEEEFFMSPDLSEDADIISELEENARVTSAIAGCIERLWNDDGIKETFANRHAFQVPDSAEYFFKEITRLARRGYIPTEQDILRCRDRTTGVTHERLVFTGLDIDANFDLYDVGGQRSERRAWVKIFQNVNAVLFVVAISEFDQLCFEDEQTNRIEDALSVFKMVINSKHFEETPVVLLFNKIDLFISKLDNGVEFNFSGYDGKQDYETIVDFVQTLFEDQNDNEDKAIITRFVSAISNDFNLDEVLKIIVEENN